LIQVLRLGQKTTIEQPILMKDDQMEMSICMELSSVIQIEKIKFVGAFANSLGKKS